MAFNKISQMPDTSGGRPDPGAILLVIHDFQARSSDELSLMKGDRVELVERDDDFGDGWYLGKHLVNGNTGLFPEVYTKPAPRGAPILSQPIIPKAIQQIVAHPLPPPPSLPIHDVRNSLPVPDTDKTAQAARHVSASQVLDTNTASPLMNMQSADGFIGNDIAVASSVPRSISLGSTPHHVGGQESPVMNETLSVIQEHITDMGIPRQGAALSVVSDRRGGNDSGSEYSTNLDNRQSYINGEETDEEENGLHNESEVQEWSPVQVSEYLASVGVEEKHCHVFKEQEITGDVLLGMDQTSVFLKEFDLGSVGRRLKTWQKIKALQDEVNGIVPTPSSPASKRTSRNFSSEASSNANRSMSATGSRIPALTDRTGQNNTRYSSQPTRTDTSTSPASPIVGSAPRRPSAASIRELNHSRKSSANEFSTTNFRGSRMSSSYNDSPLSPVETTHKKQPSFDRNWTMGSQSPISASRPLSAGLSKLPNTAVDGEPLSGVNLTTPVEFDRGYFSGNEADGRDKNVLKKRMSASHSRGPSHTDEQRLRTATSTARHSRFGSVDSIQQAAMSPASQKYYGLSMGRRRTPSADTISRPTLPSKDTLSPVVTKLDGFPQSGANSPLTPSFNKSSWLSPGGDKSTIDSPLGDSISSPTTNDSLKSPSRAGSSTNSGGPSFDLDSNPAKSPSTMATTSTRATKKKSKKETSAYTRGLEKKSPQEQMENCDFSGWMKKKSTNLMTTWKPRLFVLKGRRLSYYYSENDTEEKGLIDISFHRVLPADNERLTGLHATLTGAGTTPTSPETTHVSTMAATGASNEPKSSLQEAGPDQMFIFKLTPPRAGLSRAVNFTKPTVHYFAVPNRTIGRLWMGALMKATIDRDDTKAITTTYQQKTITLAKARAMRARPPALMNLDEKLEEDHMQTPNDASGLNIQGIVFDPDQNEEDSGVSGLSSSARQSLGINNHQLDTRPMTGQAS